MRVHDQTRDAQSVYKALVAKHEDGTAALLAINALCISITTLLLRDWKQPIVSFLLKFQTLILDLDDLTDDPTDDVTKRTWLESSFIGHPDMTNAVTTIRSTALLLNTMKDDAGSAPKVVFSFDYFFRMLNETAVRLDSTNKVVLPETFLQKQ